MSPDPGSGVFLELPKNKWKQHEEAKICKTWRQHSNKLPLKSWPGWKINDIVTTWIECIEWQWHQHQSHGAASRPWSNVELKMFLEDTTYIYDIRVWYIHILRKYIYIYVYIYIYTFVLPIEEFRFWQKETCVNFMCGCEYRIKTNTVQLTLHHYWDDLSHSPPVRLFWQSVATWAGGKLD